MCTMLLNLSVDGGCLIIMEWIPKCLKDLNLHSINDSVNGSIIKSSNLPKITPLKA